MKNHLISWIYPSCATILHARKFQWFNNDRKFIFGSPIWGFSAADVIVDPIVAYNKYSKKGPFHLWKKITVKVVVGKCLVWANSCVDTISRTIRAQPKKKGSEKKKTHSKMITSSTRVLGCIVVFSPRRRWANNNNM